MFISNFPVKTFIQRQLMAVFNLLWREKRILNLDGIVITIPHKFAALRHCDESSDRARFLGAVNVLHAFTPALVERLLQALDMAAALAHQLLAGAQQGAHFLGLAVRHETAPDQAVRQKIGEPGGIVHVGLAPRHVLDMRRVRQHQREIAVA